jgi:hypothetical protein
VKTAREWSEIAQEALSGSRPELRLFAAEGLLPMAPEELFGLRIALAQGAGEASHTARNSLGAEPPEALAAFAAEEATEGEAAWLATNLPSPALYEALLKRRDVSLELLGELAPRLGEPEQELLLLRQDKIVDAPELLDRLELNPRLSSYSRRRIREYRDHLVVSRSLEPIVEASDEEVVAAIEIVRQAVPAEDEPEQTTGLSEQQVRSLPPGVRLRLARSAKGALRFSLVRDSVARVALTALYAGAFTDGEVEQLARSRAVVDEVLEGIVNRREWVRRYPVILALVANPKLRIATAMKLLPTISVRDLRGISKDRNIAEAVRSRAGRLYTMKSG